ncbi:hypothetical protein B0J17DRAFT_634128 [Rhizoctonia solani]|nr:hypothetical protein B0J17DRAFT_634128 [Rhizoctonia solani]
MPKNPKIQDLMELGSAPNTDLDNDSANNNETTKAKKAIYRGIWNGIKEGLNAIIPGAFHGKHLWRNVTTEQRNAVYGGGWIEELIMMMQLSNAQDTAGHKAKNANTLQLKPLD